MTRRQLPRATAAQLDAATFLAGEIAVDVTNDELRYDGDGSTVGGIKLARADGANFNLVDAAFSSAWNGSTLAPTRNAIYDRLNRDAINVKDYGATGDGTTDDAAAFASAITAAGAGGTIVVPPPSVRYRLTSTLTPLANQRIVGLSRRPELRMDNAANAQMFNLTGLSGVVIENLTLDGNKSVTPSAAMFMIDDATACGVVDCAIVNAPSGALGSVDIRGASTRCYVRSSRFDNAEGIAVSLTGESSGETVTLCEVSDCHFTGSGLFGIRLGRAERNLIRGNTTQSNGVELVGMTVYAKHNRVSGNHAEGCGDNGISVSGSYNDVVGNVCYANQKAGIHVWGSFNTIAGNLCKNNNQENAGNLWAGIGVSANYGGTGQYNTISGNVCDDDQASPTQWNNIRLSGASGYSTWAAGQAVTSGSSYRINGLNIYLATTTGTTGATPPTHTTGEVSDGAVTWRYVNSFISVAESTFNVVGPNTLGRSQSASLFDADATALRNLWHTADRFTARAALLQRAAGAATLTNTTEAAAVDGLIIEGDRATPAASDSISLKFKLSDSAGNQDEFLRIAVVASDVTSGSEDGFFDLHMPVAGALTHVYRVSNTSFRPAVNDGPSLGISGTAFADLFLASGGVINWNAGNATLTHAAGLLTSNVPLRVPSYTVATVPAASLGAGAMIYVSDETGGAIVAFSDGTNWRRVTDRAVVS